MSLLLFVGKLTRAEKFDTIRLQIKKNLGDKVLSQFTTFDITQYGVAKENPENEALGTAMLYIFAQAKSKEAFGPVGSLTALVHREGLGHYPGMHTFMDSRIAQPKPYIEYWPGVVSQSLLPMTVRFVGSDEVIHVSPVGAQDETIAVIPQRDYDPSIKLTPGEYGSTTRTAIGHVVHARSGDKGGNANVGFFVPRNASGEYDWLRGLLSKQTLIEMLGEEYQGNRIERVEFPGMLAVHFVIHDYLGKGVSSTARLDSLAKSVAEYLRAKWVDVPDKFLLRGKL